MESPDNSKKLSPLWILLIPIPYYLLLFTQWGNYFHGGGPIDAMIVDAFVVLGAYACLEVFRSSHHIWAKCLLALLGVPLAAFVCLALYHDITHYYWPWAVAWWGATS